MRGLRKKEDAEFERFFEKVQEFATELDSVFFLDCGEGRDITVDNMAGEDMSGWLIPASSADAFEKDWKSGKNMERWNDCFRFAIWGEGNPFTIEFR